MKIEIKCPVCRAANQLEKNNSSCRRCKENLALLYNIKAYSFKYRLYLLQYLQQSAPKSIQLARAAFWLDKTIPTREFVLPVEREEFILIQEEYFEPETQQFMQWNEEEE